MFYANRWCKCTKVINLIFYETMSLYFKILKNLRLTSGPSLSSIGGAATSIIQNFQIQTILKEAQSGLITDVKKLNEIEICRVCSILCTAEYCIETIQQVFIDKLTKLNEISSKISILLSLKIS